jgi:hypothetical protein
MWKSLRGSVVQIITDTSADEKGTYRKYCKVKNATKAFHDFPEYAGPDVINERAEGTPIDTLQIREGFNTRVLMRSFGGQVVVSSEARDDEEHDKVIDAARRLRDAAIRTIEVDCAQFLNRAFNANYIFGDGVQLASANHLVPDGSTFSNTLSVPAAPSVAAIQTMRTAVSKLPGHHGRREGRIMKKIVCPIDQENAWEVILGSSLLPGGNNNDINTVRKMGLELIPVLHWTASATNWGAITDADHGLMYMERKKITANDWVDENTDTLHYGVTYRSGRTSVDARGHYWSEA